MTTLLRTVRLQNLINPEKHFIVSLRFNHAHPSFKASDLIIEESDHKQPTITDPTKYAFGQIFSNHMLEVAFDESSGWSRPKISALHDFKLHPATKALHYAQQLFEGMKAYRGMDGHVRLFRPDMNMKRMLRTTARAALPTFEGEELIKCMIELIKLDKDWVPENKDGQTNAMYIRPTLIGTEGALGVAKSKEALLFVILSPVGAYFDSGKIRPITLLADPKNVRAWPGGVGSMKMGSNYGPTIQIQKEAEKQGCHQILWLFGPNHEATEIGAMNFFIVKKNSQNKLQLITPPLSDGLILPGVTRDSILAMANEWPDVEPSERKITMKEIVDSLKDGSLVEAFAGGTAAIVSPIGEIKYQGQSLIFPEVTSQSLSQRAFRQLNDIYYGKVPSHPWTRLVC